MTIRKFPECESCIFFDQGLTICDMCENASEYVPDEYFDEEDDDFEDDIPFDLCEEAA